MYRYGWTKISTAPHGRGGAGPARIIAAAVLLAIAAPSLAGCAAPGGAQASGPRGAAYAPYDSETNPFCGALGTCEPLNTTPYPIRSNIGF
jgi:hypothetical protein